MDPRTQIDLFNLKRESASFWSAGNCPTQALYGLSVSEVLAHLKALYLLCDKVLAAASFYFESSITREVTNRLQLLFERGDILYFVDASIENFAEHGAKKMEKSPSGLIAYSDKTLVHEQAKRLDSLGHILRRPDYSISDRIVELWIKDMYSRDVGTVGESLSRLAQCENDRLALETELIRFAESRKKDFVWEYLRPKLMQLGLPREFRYIARRRLAQMYSVATSELLGVSLDRPEHALPTSHITTHSRFDTSLFLGCMNILGVRRCLEDLTPVELVALKYSLEFILFREFYFTLIEAIAYRRGDIQTWLPIYREAAQSYLKSGISIDEFLQSFEAFCRSMGKPQEYSRPLDLLLHVYDLFNNRFTIENFIEKVESLSKKIVPKADGGFMLEKHQANKIAPFTKSAVLDTSSKTAVLTILKQGSDYEVSIAIPRGIIEPSLVSQSISVKAQLRVDLIQKINEIASTLNELRRRDICIEACSQSSENTAEALQQNLVEIGELIYGLFLPQSVQEDLRNLTNPLLISTNDPALPWELMHDGGNFLCLKNPIGRQLRTHEGARRNPTENLASPRFLLIGNPRLDLPDAHKEVESIAEKLSNADVHVLIGEEASNLEVLSALQSGQYNVIHYAGHASFDQHNPSDSSLQLAKGKSVSASEVKRILKGRPLVFLNACASARAHRKDEQIRYTGADTEGLASAFVLGGALCVIGALWPVFDDYSAKFASIFYDKLLAGETIGDALLFARKQLVDASKEQITWGSFILYGDPTLKLNIV
jgi:hypothetical protein